MMIEYDAKQEIRKLVYDINRWNKEYFQDNSPSVSDSFYDKKLEELRQLEECYPSLMMEDSPTKIPGSDLSKGFPKYKHDWYMLSIQNALDIKSLERWIKRSPPYYGPRYSYAVEYKMDGLALTLMYHNGKLIRAVTRGDGMEGDIVTSNAVMVKGVKVFCNLPPGTVEVRGEVVMSYKTFEKYKGEYKNPRNLTSGTMKLHNPNEVAERELEFFAYEIIGGYNENYWEDRKLYQDHGFTFAPGYLIEEDSIVTYCNKLELEKDKMPYPVDGVVVKLCDYQDRDKMGHTSKYHHWQIAYKFEQDQVKSTLLSVDHQVGRTGAITPVANIRPVEILGTTVKRATLHNYDQIRRLDLKIGDKVFLEKGGEIIPKIVGVEKRDDGLFDNIDIPSVCPSCGEVPVKEGAILRCINIVCPAQIQGRLEHFVSKKCMNMKGVGPSTIERMMSRIDSFSDIYDFTEEDLIEIGFGAIESENIIGAIEDSMKPELWRFIHALGIPLIGETASKALADLYQDINELMEEVFDFNEGDIPGFGPEMTKSLVTWFLRNYRSVEDILDNGVVPYYKDKVIINEFSGKTVVITGKLSAPRDEIKAKLEGIGIIISGSVSKNTDYLLCGDKPGSKVNKASDLGIKIVYEEFFRI